MYLSEIEIENFRNFKKLSVELSSGLNVIVGTNNAGKTNLLDAIRVALGYASDPLSFIRLTEDDLYHDASGCIDYNPIKIHLTFSGFKTEEDKGPFFDSILDFNRNLDNCTGSIHYQWSWLRETERWQYKRWGGNRDNSETPVPDDILQLINITYLGALRDALTSLVPGRNNYLGHLFKSIVEKKEERENFEKFFKKANKDLKDEIKIIGNVENWINKNLEKSSGDFKQDILVQSSKLSFEKIVSSLQLVLKTKNIDVLTDEIITEDIHSNGLGYNNLIYIATILARLNNLAENKRIFLPLLLVEEPEAHLHPQLQVLLADFLDNCVTTGGCENVQTIITTHSPTIASHVSSKKIRVLHKDLNNNSNCIRLDSCQLNDKEWNKLRRMFDVTRATLLFAQGIILVEGISEAILLPIFARRLGINLEKKGISVIPICGVDFKTIGKLFGDKKLKIPVSILTDGDPAKEYCGEKTWEKAIPKKDKDGNYEISNNTQSLTKEFSGNSIVKVFSSKVTFEFDLAAAGENNINVILDAWKECSPDTAKELSENIKEDNLEDKAVRIWRRICVNDYGSKKKAELSQVLAEMLNEKVKVCNESKQNIEDYKITLDKFNIPCYIKKAILHSTKNMRKSDEKSL